MENIIFTLGTSKRSIEEFLEILKFYEILQIIDVRRWPTSKWFPHFKKENLEKILKENRIGYFHFEKLGGYRSQGYDKYTKTKGFKKALRELIEISTPKESLRLPTGRESRNIAIICAEKLPWKCHRAYIAQELEKLKFTVVHIIDKGKIWQPKKENHEIKPFCENQS